MLNKINIREVKLTKSVFVGVRFEPKHRDKLMQLSRQTDKPGNISAVLRWLVENAIEMEIQNTAASVARQGRGVQGS